MAEYIDIQSVYGLIDDLERNPDVSQFTKSLLQGVRAFLAGAPLAEKYDLDGLEKILCCYFNVPNNTYAYNLTRVKEGFAAGTVTLDDFEEFDEETISDLANYIREHLNGIETDKACDESEWEYDGPTLYLGKPPETGATSHYICSKCMHGIHTNNLSEYKYCPGCGAKMKSDENEEKVK